MKASLVLVPQAAKVTAAVCDGCLVEMRKHRGARDSALLQAPDACLGMRCSQLSGR